MAVRVSRHFLFPGKTSLLCLVKASDEVRLGEKVQGRTLSTAQGRQHEIASNGRVVWMPITGI